MKYLPRIIIGVFATVAVTSGIALSAAAQNPELTPEKLEQIRNNCGAAQSAIQRIQKSDIVTRSNRGRSYEYILQLMASLNSRIALNKLSQTRMVEITSELHAKYRSFYGHYTEYEAVIDQILRLQCTERPQEFYDTLQTLRAQRTRLADDVSQMRQLIDEYEQLVGRMLDAQAG